MLLQSLLKRDVLPVNLLIEEDLLGVLLDLLLFNSIVSIVHNPDVSLDPGLLSRNSAVHSFQANPLAFEEILLLRNRLLGFDLLQFLQMKQIELLLNGLRVAIFGVEVLVHVFLYLINVDEVHYNPFRFQLIIGSWLLLTGSDPS